MSSISIWVLSIVGIIVLSILVDIILPSGQSSKFIKNIFGYLIIIVILSPIFSFFTNKTFDLNLIFETSAVEIQDNFIGKINRQILDRLEEEIEVECYDIGLDNIDVGIEADIFQNDIDITQISVDISKIVIRENFSHTNIKVSITEIVLDNVNVQKELIVFYG